MKLEMIQMDKDINALERDIHLHEDNKKFLEERVSTEIERGMRTC